jgi:hypothetical protein
LDKILERRKNAETVKGEKQMRKKNKKDRKGVFLTIDDM